MHIIKEFEYIHHNSAKYCSVFAVGYSDDFCKFTDKDYRKIDAVLNGIGISARKRLWISKTSLRDGLNGVILETR